MGMGGGNDYTPAMSAEDRISILQEEDKLATSREMEQRQFLRQQEERRIAMESGLRIRKDIEERQRLAEITKKENKASERVAEDPMTVRRQKDVDNRISNMWSNVLSGVGRQSTNRPK